MPDVLTGWDAFERALIYQRYSIRDPKTKERLEKTYEDIIDRISNFFESHLKELPIAKEIIYEAIKKVRDREFTFATPILMNLGNPFTKRDGYYSCYPLGPIPDSTMEILKYVEACASVFQYAGGVGLDFSQLRPKGSGVDSAQGESSGPVGFIPLFESTAKSIAAGGKRRGAMLGQLNYNHPDIFEFVKLKRGRRDLWSINISVNAFGDFWNQKELIKEIAKGMWISGDPGLLFPDEMALSSPYPPNLKPLARYVNPCVTSDTYVATDNGEIPIAELAKMFEGGKEFRVLNGFGHYTRPLRVWKTRENTDVVKVKFSDNHELKVTPDHKFLTLTKQEFLELRSKWIRGLPLKLQEITYKEKQAKQLDENDYVLPESFVRNVGMYNNGGADTKVVSVEPIDEKMDVYNLTEPETHSVFFNGILTRQCGEYLSPPFSVCHLITGSALSAESHSDFESLGYYMTHIGNAILWHTLQTGRGIPQEPSWLKKRLLERIQQLHPLGVGLTGLAEYLYKKKIDYANVDEVTKIYTSLAKGSLTASHEWSKVTKEEKEWDPNYKERHLSQIGYPLKKSNFWNTTTLSQAPTGSVSQFLRCVSTGIEPLESFDVDRKFLNDEGKFQSVSLSSRVKPINSVPLKFIPPEDQIRVVSAIQGISHTSASKTINVPQETTEADIIDIIYTSQKYRLKGLTIYRRGCALDSIVDVVKKEQIEDTLHGSTYKFKGLNNIYVTVNETSQNKLSEVFVMTGKSGSAVNGLAMGLGRLASLALRSGTKPEVIVKSLSDIETGDYYSHSKIGRVTSICDAVAKVIQLHLKKTSQIKEEFDLCPKCQSFTLVRNGQGCKHCSKCGYSTC